MDCKNRPISKANHHWDISRQQGRLHFIRVHQCKLVRFFLPNF